MATSEKQILANRENGKKSKGAVSRQGKAVSCMNALRHGVLSTKLILQEERAGEYYRLLDELISDLKPHGITEHILVEKIAVVIWKQRRLTAAETARIDLDRQSHAIFKVINKALGREYSDPVTAEYIEPIPKDHLQCYETVHAELGELLNSGDNITLADIEKDAPTAWESLLEEAVDEGMPIELYIRNHEKGAVGWVVETYLRCNNQLERHKNRPQMLSMIKSAKDQKSILADNVRESYDRYAAALDGQLYKAMKELRLSQEHRMRSLETIQVEQVAA